MDLERLEGFILSRMREFKVPGLSIGIVKGNELIYARGFGFRDLERGLPASPGTVYGIGSITKTFTALSILRLVQEGRLDLMDPVDKYIPLRLRPFGEPVRIHHLLTHTSGIPALGYAEAFINGVLGLEANLLPLATPDDVITFMRDAERWAVARPGERFFYLNEGYVLLGRIISKVSGVSYEDYVTRNILKPLGMDRSYFRAEDFERDPDTAAAYIITRDGDLMRSRFPFGVTSDGGLLSNVIDMSRFVSMLINRGSLGGVTIVSREYLELAERKYVDVPWRVIGDEGYGYGLIISNEFFGRKLIYHSGNVLVHVAFMGYIPSDGIGVIVMANSEGYSPTRVGLYALSLMLNHDPARELRIFREEEIARKLEGVYEAYGGTVRMIIKRQGDYLVMTSTTRYTQESVVLVPEDIREDYARYFAWVNGYKLPAEFYIRSDGVYLIYERFKFEKKGPI
ncbi:MAG: serine hydrolase [Vulcanisaeta sp.]|nr:serine hydrolase [Vulcanisaeta sp.]MCG2870319.1 serine hydrolase [Vulcanisaeta sp.]MCG2887652.1 serine hydrolase [Vulcanisaeta sp.]